MQGSKERPNPMYNVAYGEAATYPIFYARHISQFITSPLVLMDLFLVSGVSNNTRFFILFANAMAVFVTPPPHPLPPPFPSLPPSLHTCRPARRKDGASGPRWEVLGGVERC